VSALEAARDHYLGLLAARRAELGPEPGWLAALRDEAREAFADRGFPHPRLEEWRYTNLAPLAKARFEFAPAGPALVSEAELESLAFPLFACSNATFVDGRFAPGLSVPRALEGAVRVESLAALRTRAPERLEPHLGSLGSVKEHPFAALNTAFLDDGAALLVPPGASVAQPAHLVFLASREAVQNPRVLVVAGAGSQVALIQDHVSLGEAPGFTNAVTEVLAGPGARVDLVLLQREGAGSFHVSNLQVRQERDSRVSVHTICLGGRLLRNDAEALLADEGAELSLRGLFLGGGSQLVDNHTLVDHAMPRGTSRQLYKGILGGRARGVFRGRVVVRPDAQRTDARQSNPNLLLSDGAEVDSKPQLEIYADDVRCSHGSSIGRLDEDALFYLRARGLEEPAARELLIRGFAAEILTALPSPALGEALAELLDRRLRGLRADPDREAA
jgi:Fe-S cluster assembly protein SufD